MTVMTDIIKRMAKGAMRSSAVIGTSSRRRGSATSGERLGAATVRAFSNLHKKSKTMSGSSAGTKPVKAPSETIKAPAGSTSSTPQQAVEQLGELSSKTLESVGGKVDKTGKVMVESAEALGTDVVSALKELEKSLVGQARPKRSASGSRRGTAGSDDAGAGVGGKEGDPEKGPLGDILKKSGVLAALSTFGIGVTMLGAGVGLIEYGKATVKPKPVVKGSPAWWLGLDPLESREQRLERLRGGKDTRPDHAVDAPKSDFWGGVGSAIGSLFSSGGWVQDGKSTKARNIDFKAKRMVFDFKEVKGLGGGGGGGYSAGQMDDSEDTGAVEQSYPGSGARPEDYDPSKEAAPAAKPQGTATLDQVIKGPSQRKVEPQSTPGVNFSNPTQDPAARGLTGGKVETSSLLPAEKVKDFWKDRNPNGAQIYDKEGKPVVNEQLLHSEAAGIKAFEAAHPEYRVEMYGPSSGERHSGSIANHGDQADGKGGALDVVIVDKRTGQKLTNHPGSNHQYQGTVGENAPIYQELFNSTVSAAGKLYPGSEDKYRYGGYFATGSNAMDLMHTDVRSREAPMGGGGRESGFTAAQMKAWGIRDNYGLKDNPVKFSDAVPASSVTTLKTPSSPWKNPGFAPQQAQPQGSFAAPPADVEPDKKVVVKPLRNDTDSGKGDRVRKKKFRQTGGDASATQIEQLRFSQYLNVENDEEQ